MAAQLAYTLKEAAEALRLHPQTVRKIIKRGHLQPVPHMGQRIVIAGAELERFLNAKAES